MINLLIKIQLLCKHQVEEQEPHFLKELSMIRFAKLIAK
jgi:hypothetical protein